MARLILASTSPYRRQLLERLGLPFEVRPANADESAGADHGSDGDHQKAETPDD